MVPYVNDSDSKKYYLVLKEFENTGNIIGNDYVGGLIGYGFSEGETTLTDYSQEGEVTYVGTNGGNLSGYLKNISI